MIVNRKELARRVAAEGNYDIGQSEELIKHLEDVIVDALEKGEEVKLGKLFKIYFQNVPRKKAWDGLNKKYFIREPKKVPKFKPLTRIEEIELEGE